MAGEQHTHRLTERDGLASPHGRRNWLVRRAQPAGMIDADHGAARDRAGEGDHTRASRPHH